MWNLGSMVITVAGKINNFIEATIGWKNIAAVVAALIGVKLVGAVLAAGAALMTIIPAIKAMGLAMMANPIGLIIKLIAVGTTLIHTSWSTVSTFLGDTFDAIVNACSDAFEIIKKYFLNFTPLGYIVSNWEGISDFFSNLWDEINQAFDGGVTGIAKSFLSYSPLGLIR